MFQSKQVVFGAVAQETQRQLAVFDRNRDLVENGSVQEKELKQQIATEQRRLDENDAAIGELSEFLAALKDPKLVENLVQVMGVIEGLEFEIKEREARLEQLAADAAKKDKAMGSRLAEARATEERLKQGSIDRLDAEYIKSGALLAKVAQPYKTDNVIDSKAQEAMLGPYRKHIAIQATVSGQPKPKGDDMQIAIGRAVQRDIESLRTLIGQRIVILGRARELSNELALLQIQLQPVRKVEQYLGLQRIDDDGDQQVGDDQKGVLDRVVAKSNKRNAAEGLRTVTTADAMANEWLRIINPLPALYPGQGFALIRAELARAYTRLQDILGRAVDDLDKTEMFVSTMSADAVSKFDSIIKELKPQSKTAEGKAQAATAAAERTKTVGIAKAAGDLIDHIRLLRRFFDFFNAVIGVEFSALKIAMGERGPVNESGSVDAGARSGQRDVERGAHDSDDDVIMSASSAPAPASATAPDASLLDSRRERLIYIYWLLTTRDQRVLSRLVSHASFCARCWLDVDTRPDELLDPPSATTSSARTWMLRLLTDKNNRTLDAGQTRFDALKVHITPAVPDEQMLFADEAMFGFKTAMDTKDETAMLNQSKRVARTEVTGIALAALGTATASPMRPHKSHVKTDQQLLSSLLKEVLILIRQRPSQTVCTIKRDPDPRGVALLDPQSTLESVAQSAALVQLVQEWKRDPLLELEVRVKGTQPPTESKGQESKTPVRGLSRDTFVAIRNAQFSAGAKGPLLYDAASPTQTSVDYLYRHSDKETIRVTKIDNQETERMVVTRVQSVDIALRSRASALSASSGLVDTGFELRVSLKREMPLDSKQEMARGVAFKERRKTRTSMHCSGVKLETVTTDLDLKMPSTPWPPTVFRLDMTEVETVHGQSRTPSYEIEAEVDRKLEAAVALADSRTLAECSVCHSVWSSARSDDRKSTDKRRSDDEGALVEEEEKIHVEGDEKNTSGQADDAPEKRIIRKMKDDYKTFVNDGFSGSEQSALSKSLGLERETNGIVAVSETVVAIVAQMHKQSARREAPFAIDGGFVSPYYSNRSKDKQRVLHLYLEDAQQFLRTYVERRIQKRVELATEIQQENKKLRLQELDSPGYLVSAIKAAAAEDKAQSKRQVESSMDLEADVPAPRGGRSAIDDSVHTILVRKFAQMSAGSKIAEITGFPTPKRSGNSLEVIDSIALAVLYIVNDRLGGMQAAVTRQKSSTMTYQRAFETQRAYGLRLLRRAHPVSGKAASRVHEWIRELDAAVPYVHLSGIKRRLDASILTDAVNEDTDSAPIVPLESRPTSKEHVAPLGRGTVVPCSDRFAFCFTETATAKSETKAETRTQVSVPAIASVSGAGAGAGSAGGLPAQTSQSGIQKRIRDEIDKYLVASDLVEELKRVGKSQDDLRSAMKQVLTAIFESRWTDWFSSEHNGWDDATKMRVISELSMHQFNRDFGRDTKLKEAGDRKKYEILKTAFSIDILSRIKTNVFGGKPAVDDEGDTAMF